MFADLLHYRFEFLSIAFIHLLAVASPGPDFAIVLKHSVSYGRRAAILTSIGVGFAILLHVAYSLLGLGVMIKATPWLFNVLTYIAAGYLAWIGFQALTTKAKALTQQKLSHQMNSISDRKAFLTGFLTNGLNPKATLFFLSLFAVVISVQTPNSVKVIYGVYLAAATGAWFCLLSYFLSVKYIRQFISQKGYWFDRVMGLLLIGLAVKLIVS